MPRTTDTSILAAIRRRLRRSGARPESGFILIELLVGALILTLGAIAAVSAFGASKRLSLVAQRHEIAVHIAQKELERLHSLAYGRLGLTSAPTVANRLQSDPNQLGYYINAATTDASSFTARSAAGLTPALAEHLVLADSAPGAGITPGPTSFTVGNGGIKGKIYRYVTWRPESCGADSTGRPYCPGTRNVKRLVVGVTIQAANGGGPKKPVWVTSIAIDPNSAPFE